MTCITWNIEWASPASARGRYIKSVIAEIDPDVLCVTETTLAMLPSYGHAIESNPDYGYQSPRNRRKVVLWSREPWQSVDSTGSDTLPGGRFVSGVTFGIRFIGVCIPWRDAHVRTGRQDREPWEDHLAYLDGLGPIVLKFCDDGSSVCVTGDFNQRVPGRRTKRDLAGRLSRALGDELRVATAGIVNEEGRPLIDHVAVSEELDVEIQSVIPRKSPDGLRLSDHSGVLFQTLGH